VVTDGFYEWKKLDDGRKQPYRIVMRDREPFALAGLWEKWKPRPDAGPGETFTIITTEPNAVCAPIHNRMPVVITPADFDAWLTAAPGSEALLRRCPPEPMESYPVSKAVGSMKNDGPELVEGSAFLPSAPPPYQAPKETGYRATGISNLGTPPPR
jgi:putative SOS response-associated peptidase YedK